MADPTQVPEQVTQAKDFFAEREGAESQQRTAFNDDVRFAYMPGEQWDDTARSKRQGRPCYTYNRTAGAINGLVGDQRQINPSGIVRPANKASVLDTANTFGGLIRDIEAKSFAPSTYAEGFKYAAAGGWGVWRIVQQFAPGDTFDQVLRIARVANPLTAYFDGDADPFGRFGKRALVSERMHINVYRATFGDDAAANLPVNFPAVKDSRGWFGADMVRVAEYWRKIARTKKIVQLTDGRVFDADKVEQILALAKAAGETQLEVHDERMRDFWVCEWTKIDGMQTLEGPIEYQYEHIPLIRCPGRYINIEGEPEYQSLIRHGKDAARTYNYNRSNMVETTALTPRAPWLVTNNMIKGYEDEWKRSNTSNAPFLRYNIDEDNPEATPSRNAGPEVPQAYIALSAADAEDIRQTIGFTNPAVEQQTRAGDAESGRALRTRLGAGDTGSFEFLDNYGKAIQYTWECLVGMIPHVYTSKRIERLLQDDGTEEFLELDPAKLKDGIYDVAITLGPAHATARMQALDTLLEASTIMPLIAEEAPDLLVKYMDVRGAPELERRIRNRLIANGRIVATEKDLEQGAQIPQADPGKAALIRQLDAKGARDTAVAERTTLQTASEMSEAQRADESAAVDLAQKIADLILTRMEVRKTAAETGEIVAGVSKDLNTPPAAPTPPTT